MPFNFTFDISILFKPIVELLKNELYVKTFTISLLKIPEIV